MRNVFFYYFSQHLMVYQKIPVSAVRSLFYAHHFALIIFTFPTFSYLFLSFILFYSTLLYSLCLTLVIFFMWFSVRWNHWMENSSNLSMIIIWVLTFPLVSDFTPIGYASFTFLYSLSILWSLAFARPRSFLASNLARLFCKFSL